MGSSQGSPDPHDRMSEGQNCPSLPAGREGSKGGDNLTPLFPAGWVEVGGERSTPELGEVGGVPFR